MNKSGNYLKYQTRNPLKLLLIDSYYKKLNCLISNLNFKNCLDAGCGEGFDLLKLKETSLYNKKIIGVDLSRPALSVAQKTLPNCKFYNANIINLPFKNKTFDLVLCLEVLEHLRHPHLAIRELERVTRKYIIYSVPNEPWFSLLRMLGLKNLLSFGNHPEHLQRWNKNSFRVLLSENLRNSSVKITSSFPWLIIIINYEEKNI